MRHTRLTRGFVVLPQMAGLLLSLGVGVGVSLCPPGMDMGMDMPTATMDGNHRSMDCPFGGTMDEEGKMACPLAVGGVGPCGTSATASNEPTIGPNAILSHTLVEYTPPPGHTNPPRTTKLPPPRA